MWTISVSCCVRSDYMYQMFGRVEADLVCRQLDYQGGIVIPKYPDPYDSRFYEWEPVQLYGRSNGPILMVGEEAHVSLH